MSTCNDCVLLKLDCLHKINSIPSESLPVHQVETEGKELYGQGRSSSDSEDYLTPPPAKRVSDVSVHVVKV